MKRIFSIICLIVIIIAGSVQAKDVLSYIPNQPQTALVILHGYGQSGEKMSWMTEKLKTILPHTAFYYPTAPGFAPYGGYQWFVLPTMGAEMITIENYNKMLTDATENVDFINKLIDKIHKDLNLTYENIDIAGFSQGGLMSVLSGLTNNNKLGRIVSFSGVPLVKTTSFSDKMIVSKPDILLIQGSSDNVVPKDSIDLTIKTLAPYGIIPETYIIPGMGHTINDEAINTMVNFLQ